MSEQGQRPGDPATPPIDFDAFRAAALDERRQAIRGFGDSIRRLARRLLGGMPRAIFSRHRQGGRATRSRVRSA